MGQYAKTIVWISVLSCCMKTAHTQLCWQVLGSNRLQATRLMNHVKL
jgi:hypothetical protein